MFNQETNQVVGVAFAGSQEAEGHGFIIPVPVMKLFMQEFQRSRNPLGGLLPELGVNTEELVNPAMRKSCFGGKMPSHRNGCLVTSVLKHSCAHGKIKAGDILLAIDDVVVSEKAEVVFRGQEHLPWKHRISIKSRVKQCR